MFAHGYGQKTTILIFCVAVLAFGIFTPSLQAQGDAAGVGVGFGTDGGGGTYSGDAAADGSGSSSDSYGGQSGNLSGGLAGPGIDAGFGSSALNQKVDTSAFQGWSPDSDFSIDTLVGTEMDVGHDAGSGDLFFPLDDALGLDHGQSGKPGATGDRGPDDAVSHGSRADESKKLLALRSGSEPGSAADGTMGQTSLFGYDVFRRFSAAMASNPDTPMRPDYVVGQGDEFEVFIWGREEARFAIRINVDGEVIIPRVGPVKVAGLTFNDMKSAIEDAIASKYSDFRLTIAPRKQRRMRVFVLGEVMRPGVFDLGGAATAYTALFAAGGPNGRGTMRNISLQRDDKTIAVIDLYDFLLFGKRSTDIPLQEGDVIHVPLVGQRVAVQGKVRRPAVYELKPGEQSLKKILTMAGEILPTGDVKRVRIQRIEPHQGRVVFNANAGSAPVPDSRPDTTAQDLDVMTVFPISPRERQEVILEGHVFNRGPRPWKPGMKISDLLSDSKIFQRDPCFDYAEILRQTGPGDKLECLSFNPARAMARQAEYDLDLKAKDRIRILASAEVNEVAWVHISGEVVRPGRLRLIPGTTIKDLLLRAGGLRQSADADRGDLTRVVVKDGKKHDERLIISPARALNENPSHNLKLRAGDRLVVRTIPNWRDHNNVTLSGEFVYPGVYTFLPGERISDLIARAGGFTDRAFLKGAVLKRTSVFHAQQAQLRKIINTTQIESRLSSMRRAVSNTFDDSSARDRIAIEEAHGRLLGQLSEMAPEGRVVIRLAADASFQGSKEDILLEPGDHLSVPQPPSTISVEGAVGNAISMVYEPGLTVAHYLEKAGGRTRWADPHDLYVVRADGTTLGRGKRPGRCFAHTRVEPGDTIWVPLDLRPLPTQKLKQIQAITQILGNIALTALAIDRGSR